DLVTGERELVTAASGGAVESGEKLQSVVARRILHAVARFVGEFAKVHFPRVRGGAEHIDVSAGAEHSFFRAGKDDAGNFRIFETDALKNVVELDVDAQVVRIQFEFVAGAEAAVFVDVHGESGDTAVDREFPVARFA